MPESIFIIGATGKVGRTLVSQIYDKGDTDPQHRKNPISVVGVASSTSFLYDPDGLREKLVRDFASRSTEGDAYKDPIDLVKLLRASEDSVTMIDVTPSQEMLVLHKKVIEETHHKIVTANKNPLVQSDFSTFQTLTANPKRYRYRCSVMAGAEAVDIIRDMRDLGEIPTEITGSFSGTLAYITSELEAGRKLSAALSKAITEGYTEPDPTIDLSGTDVANKILILVRTAGVNASIDDVKVAPFIPEEYLSESDPNRLLLRVKEIDEDMKLNMDNALKKNSTFKYIARFVMKEEGPEISVGLQSMSRDSPLGQLRGTANKIVIKSNIYKDRYYSVEAPGAGLLPTAMNIRRDLLYQNGER